MPALRSALVAVLAAGSLSCAHFAYGQSINNIVDQTFQRAILKVEVSAPQAVFNGDGKNVCKSEGTAFLIGDNLAVTASHVYALDPACGEPVILLESTSYTVQAIAKVLAVAEDVTLLEISKKAPAPMCALALSATDVTFVDGVRFGIPAGMDYPTPMQVKIGPKDSNFKPFIQLTPTPAEQGESGGPIIYMFNVVGILRAKHAAYPGYSVMTPIGELRSLLKTVQIPIGGTLCNPVEISIFYPDSINVGVQIKLPAAVGSLNAPDFMEVPDCPACVSVTALPSGPGQKSTIEVRSHSKSPPPASAGVPFDISAASAIARQNADNAALRNRNFTNVRDVSKRITDESNSQIWQNYMDVKGRDARSMILK